MPYSTQVSRFLEIPLSSHLQRPNIDIRHIPEINREFSVNDMHIFLESNGTQNWSRTLLFAQFWSSFLEILPNMDMINDDDLLPHKNLSDVNSTTIDWYIGYELEVGY